MSIFNTNLPDRATEVINAGKEQNTALRVGSLFADIISYIGSQEPDWLRNTGGSGGEGGYTTPGSLLQSLWQQGNPAANKILKYDGNNWVPIDVPAGGGSGGGISESDVWQILGTDISTKLIPATYLNLSGCLSAATTFWGNTASNNAVTGSLTGGIQFIEFSNGVKLGVDSETNTIKVYRDDLDAAHFYATGGVSALGYSSPGGGGGGGGTSPTLNAILGSINGSTNAVPSFDSSKNYIVLGQGDGTSRNWNVVENSLGRLSNVTISSSVSNGQSLVYRNGTWVNELVNSGGGATSLLGLSDTPNAWSEPNNKQFLRYNDGAWINSDLPAAEPNALGVVKPGTGLSVTDGTLNHSNSIIAANSSFGLYKLKYDAQGHITGTTSVVKADITALGIPGQDTNTTYSAGNGLNDLNGGTVFSVKAASGGGLAVDSTGVKISSSRILWGNTDYLTNDLGKSGDNKSLSYVQDISMYGSVVMNSKNSQIQMSDPAGTTRNVLNLTDKNQTDIYYGSTLKAFLDVGYGCARVTTGDNKSALRLWGNDILFKANGSDNNNRNTMILTKEGSTYLPLATTGPKSGNTYTGAGPAAGLRIGDAVLYWDEANQALALAKYNVSTPSSPTAANFYATGGVSALGMSSGSGSVGAMTFDNVTVNNTLTSTKLVLNNSSNAVLLNILSGKIQVSSNGGMVEALIKGGSTITLGDATNNECEIYMYDSSGDKYSFDIDAAINAGILVEA